ncbi:MAG: VWA domain-containing protein [Terriglobales bacterium]
MLWAVVPLLAQQMPTFRSDVKVVNVLATVRDKKGNIVNTLNKDDFVLEEDGKPQTIKYFSRDTDLPLTLGLLVDTSYSQLQALESEKRASGSFVNNVLREGKDSVFLIHFDFEVELLQDVTSSRDKMVSALQLLQAPEMQSHGGYPGGRGGGRRGGGSGGGTLLYDSIYLASDEVVGRQQGRKAIIVLTDGVDHGSKMSLDRAIETAQRADVMVYSVYFEGQEGGFQRPIWGGGGGRRGGGWPGGGGRFPQPTSSGSSDEGKKILERLSRQTGGRMFTVSKKQPIEQIYSQIQDELRSQYNLGYSPQRTGDNTADYHQIRVTTKEKDLKVQAREGYYGSRQVAERRGD